MSNNKIVSYTANPDLKTVHPAWPGTPLDKYGKFINYLQPMTIGLKDVFKWQTSVKPDKAAKKADTFRLAVTEANNFITSTQDGIVWLGHASFLIRLAGVFMIIDPVFGTPSPFMKRFSALPINTDLLTNLDLILLSHDHRDHADKPSMKKLAAQNPNVQYLSGLNMGALLHSFTGSRQVQEAGWFQQYLLKHDLRITFVPSRHWGKRWLTDDNTRLWGGFMIESAQKTIYFGGDSGYGPHFKEIGEIFPNIDVAMLGIGAFRPEWFMSVSHTSPSDAYKAFIDCKAKTMIPMHYGTLNLADEPLGEPYRLISMIKAEKNANISILAVGETMALGI
jgi:L-ascorbate metabolism protein UlaG (beta-lactamase superfamily)